MKTKGWIWIAVSVAFEVAGDAFVKYLAASGTIRLWLATLFSYNLMLIAWMLAIRQFQNITIPGMIWLLCGQVAVVVLGVGVFHEALSISQALGVGLSIIAVILLCL